MFKCEDENGYCECKDCEHFHEGYCTYFDTDNMCYKCDWSGSVRMCPNKVLRDESFIF